jgi:hypothetical protein
VIVLFIRGSHGRGAKPAAYHKRECAAVRRATRRVDRIEEEKALARGLVLCGTC